MRLRTLSPRGFSGLEPRTPSAGNEHHTRHELQYTGVQCSMVGIPRGVQEGHIAGWYTYHTHQGGIYTCTPWVYHLRKATTLCTTLDIPPYERHTEARSIPVLPWV